MACSECLNTVCIDLYIGMCDEGINTGVSVTEAGEYTVMIEFNNTVQRFAYNLDANETIVLENILNLDYVHTMTIYNSDNELVDDTCYKLHTRLAMGISNNIAPTPASGAKKLIIIDEDGESYTDAFFALHNIIEIVTNNQAYLVDVDFTQSGSTITWINGNSFYNGQTILAQA